MDWTAILLSAQLALATLLVLMPLAIAAARWLAFASFGGKAWVEGLLALPLVLPPTVLGYYLLVSMGGQSAFGQWFEALAGQTLAFSFPGLVVASVIFNIPFAVQPIQRAFEGIPPDVREAAAVLRTDVLADVAHDRAAPRLARPPVCGGDDLCAHARRVRRSADGRRQHPG
jgi:molybdate transport system permease protein